MTPQQITDLAESARKRMSAFTKKWMAFEKAELDKELERVRQLCRLNTGHVFAPDHSSFSYLNGDRRLCVHCGISEGEARQPVEAETETPDRAISLTELADGRGVLSVGDIEFPLMPGELASLRALVNPFKPRG